MTQTLLPATAAVSDEIVPDTDVNGSTSASSDGDVIDNSHVPRDAPRTGTTPPAWNAMKADRKARVVRGMFITTP